MKSEKRAGYSLTRDSGRILEKVPLSGHPNNLAITKDGRRILVGAYAKGTGALDVHRCRHGRREPRASR